MNKIKAIFCDVGGVLLTNGWDHSSRIKASEMFNFDAKEFEGRHQLLFGDYETGKISLEYYLGHSLFFQPRSFSYQAFVDFMYEQSQAHYEMIDLIRKVKKEHSLKIVIFSNEGRELMLNRIKKFALTEFVDFFIVSCFVGLRKPDRTLYQMALDFSQAAGDECIYIDDRALFVEIANDLGIRSICHHDVATTSQQLAELLSH